MISWAVPSGIAAWPVIDRSRARRAAARTGVLPGGSRLAARALCALLSRGPASGQGPAETAAASRGATAGTVLGGSVEQADRRDIQATLGGDGEAYARIVRRYQQAIGDHLWHFTRERNDFEELVQEVFVQAYLHLRSYGGRAPLLHWLMRIATRTGYKYWKQQARRRSVVQLSLHAQESAATPDDPAAGRDEAEHVRQLVARLAPRDRLVLTLIYFEQCDVAETARRTGWSRTLVKVQAHRARQRLKRLLEEPAR